MFKEWKIYQIVNYKILIKGEVYSFRQRKKIIKIRDLVKRVM